MHIYVASSWRNDQQQGVVRALRKAGHSVYDFKNPEPGDVGFHWSQVFGGVNDDWTGASSAEFVEALKHPMAEAGFSKDYNSMKDADACVLVMPCGRSAHLEAGWFVGAGKPLVILLESGEPELMYKMADGLALDMDEVLLCLERAAPDHSSATKFDDCRHCGGTNGPCSDENDFCCDECMWDENSHNRGDANNGGERQ